MQAAVQVSPKPEVCVVTGASTGIGKAIARALLDDNRAVVNIDRDPPPWEHPLLHSYQANLASAAEVKQAAAKISSEFDVTALVNNAGTTRTGSVDTQTTEDLEYLARLHLQAPMLLSQAFISSLRSCGQGRIVNISSRAALGRGGRLAYSATKSGMIGMMRTLALELGKDGVTVNVVAPGPIETDLFLAANPEGSESSKRVKRTIVMGRMGTPEDVAHAVMYFLSPLSGFTTGQVLYVCGGTMLGAGLV